MFTQKNQSPSLRLLLIGIFGILLITLACWFATGPRKPSIPETKLAQVSIRFPIPAVRPSLGPFLVADEMGWYAEKGISVRFDYGGESTNPVAMVLSGTNEIGVMGGPDTVLIAIGKGAPLVILAIMHKDSNMPCIITKKSSGIKSIQQLQDKKVGIFNGHISTDVLRAWFRKEGVAVREVGVGYDYSQFLAGHIDAQWAFTTAAAVELAEKGEKINVLNPSESGIYTHGFTIFSSRDYIEKHPNRIKSFLEGTFQGVERMYSNPEEVSELVVRKDTTGNLDQPQVLRRIHQYNEFTSCNNPLPPGYFDKQMLESTYDRLLEVGAIERPYEIDKAFTNLFISEVPNEPIGTSREN